MIAFLEVWFAAAFVGVGAWGWIGWRATPSGARVEHRGQSSHHAAKQ